MRDKQKLNPFALRLNWLLVVTGKKKKEAAAAIGINNDVLSRLLAGKTTPRTDTLQKTARAFSVSIDWLLGKGSIEDYERSTKA